MEAEKAFKVEHSAGNLQCDTLSVQTNLDDTHFAVGCSDGQVRIYSSSTCHLVRSLNCRLSTLTPSVTSIRWRPSASLTPNVLFATTADGFVSHWHATSGKLLDHFQLPDTQVLCSDITRSGLHFALGCSDNTVKVFDESSRDQILTFEAGRGSRPGHSNRIFAVKWLDSDLILSGGWDKNVLLWDVRTGRNVGGVFGPQIGGESVDFYENSLYTGSYDIKEQVQVWDIRTFANVVRVSLGEENKPKVYALQVQKAGGDLLLAGCTGEMQLIAFNRQSLQKILTKSDENSVFGLDFFHRGNKFVAVTTQQEVKVYGIIEEKPAEVN